MIDGGVTLRRSRQPYEPGCCKPSRKAFALLMPHAPGHGGCPLPACIKHIDLSHSVNTLQVRVRVQRQADVAVPQRLLRHAGRAVMLRTCDGYEEGCFRGCPDAVITCAGVVYKQKPASVNATVCEPLFSSVVTGRKAVRMSEDNQMRGGDTRRCNGSELPGPG